jgi:lipid-binding SYLF domain-containing protein
MKLHRILGLGLLSLSLMAGSAFAATKAEKQAEINKSTQSALAKFYAAKPELKAAVAKAPGYGVFTTYGLSFIIGGSGGSGMVYDNQTKKTTYMSVAAASAGMQISATETDMLIVFKTPAAMANFIDKGWTAANTVGATAAAGTKSAGGTADDNAMAGFDSYTLTKAGLSASLAVTGAKFWKDGDLN